tara:strand:- start:322 stop:669 length:348 start_codon:yes stop_codon:yes gene_type:complete
MAKLSKALRAIKEVKKIKKPQKPTKEQQRQAGQKALDAAKRRKEAMRGVVEDFKKRRAPKKPQAAAGSGGRGRPPIDKKAAMERMKKKNADQLKAARAQKLKIEALIRQLERKKK